MKRITLLLIVIIEFSTIMSQASMLKSDSNTVADKDLTGLNYYDFYVDYINDYYKNFYYGGQYYDLSIRAHINEMSDLTKWFRNNLTNCFYDWCLLYVDVDNDSILSQEELDVVRVINDASDPTHLLGRDAVDYHFDWFPNLETLELNNPSWRYMVGNKNLTLYINAREFFGVDDYIRPWAEYFNDNKPFAHLYLPQTGKLKKVDIKNSEMLFFDYDMPQGSFMPEINIEGSVYGGPHSITNWYYTDVQITDKFNLDRYIGNGFDVDRIIEIDNASLCYDESGKPFLLFDEGEQEAHMKYLISTDPVSGKQNVCESTIRINPQSQWHLQQQQAIHEGESVALDEEHFPDENFRAWLSINVDFNHDYLLTYNELGSITKIRAAWNDGYYPSDAPNAITFEGENYLMATENFKGIEYLHALSLLALGEFGSYDKNPQDIKYYKVKHLDLRRNVNLEYFYMGKFTEVIDVKLPDTDRLEKAVYYETDPPLNYYPENTGPYGVLTTSRLVTLDQDKSYSLQDEIENGLDMDRLSVIKGGHLEGDKVVFDEPVVTLQYIARPPIMGGALYESHGWVRAFYCQYNLNITKLYNSSFYDMQDVVDDLSGINFVNVDKEISSIEYFNLNGMRSREPFKGFNIRVTTYSDGTRSTEKIIK